RRRALSRAGKAFSRQIGLRQIGRGSAQDFVLLLQQLDSAAASRSSADSLVLVPGLTPSSTSA
ncbi:hypothetical protein, partial [Mycobacterium interjectum]|uniref:hypothetical protein n=1 Tax=Mycobacterium interjectum TaxID=33895 RepID=UPI003555D88A